MTNQRREDKRWPKYAAFGAAIGAAAMLSIIVVDAASDDPGAEDNPQLAIAVMVPAAALTGALVGAVVGLVRD